MSKIVGGLVFAINASVMFVLKFANDFLSYVHIFLRALHVVSNPSQEKRRRSNELMTSDECFLYINMLFASISYLTAYKSLVHANKIRDDYLHEDPPTLTEAIAWLMHAEAMTGSLFGPPTLVRFGHNAVAHALALGACVRNPDETYLWYVDTSFKYVIVLNTESNIITVSCSGSFSFQDWITNLTLWPAYSEELGARVHAGFLQKVMNIRNSKKIYLALERIEKQFAGRSWTLVFNGHSQGGALAHILARLIQRDLAIKKEYRFPQINGIEIAAIAAPSAFLKIPDEPDMNLVCPPIMHQSSFTFELDITDVMLLFFGYVPLPGSVVVVAYDVSGPFLVRYSEGRRISDAFPCVCPHVAHLPGASHQYFTLAIGLSALIDGFQRMRRHGYSAQKLLAVESTAIMPD